MLSEREKFIALVGNDRLEKADSIIILEGDGINRIKKACELYKNGWGKHLVFSGNFSNIPNGSYPFDYLKNEFALNGVSVEEVIVEAKSLNTYEQAIEITDLCVINNWRSFIIVASPYHQYRAFLTFLQVLINKKLTDKIRIINSSADDLSWFDNLPWGNRYDLLDVEFKKIEEYFTISNVASFTDAIAYFKWKESH